MQKVGTGVAPLLVGGLVLAGIVVMLQPRSTESPAEVDLTIVEKAPVRLHADALRFAVSPVLVPDQALDAYQPLADSLGIQVGRPFRLIQRKTYGEVVELLRGGTVHLAGICTGAYLEAQENNVPLDVIALPLIGGKTVYQSVFLVRADSEFRSLADLAGHSFAYTDPLSLSGHTWPNWLLLEQGRDPKTFFSRTMFTYSHDGSIHAVLDGMVESAAVDSLVYDFEVSRNPSVGTRLRIIESSEPLPIPPIVTPASLDSGLRNSIAKALLGMHETAEGRKILEVLKIQRFVAPTPEAFDRAAAMHARVRKYLEPK